MAGAWPPGSVAAAVKDFHGTRSAAIGRGLQCGGNTLVEDRRAASLGMLRCSSAGRRPEVRHVRQPMSRSCSMTGSTGVISEESFHTSSPSFGQMYCSCIAVHLQAMAHEHTGCSAVWFCAAASGTGKTPCCAGRPEAPLRAGVSAGGSPLRSSRPCPCSSSPCSAFADSDAGRLVIVIGPGSIWNAGQRSPPAACAPCAGPAGWRCAPLAAAAASA